MQPEPPDDRTQIAILPRPKDSSGYETSVLRPGFLRGPLPINGITPYTTAMPDKIVRVRIGTWNLEGKWSPEHLALLDREDCDVWLLTEAHIDASIPGMEIHRTAELMGPRKDVGGDLQHLRRRSTARPASRDRLGAHRWTPVHEFCVAMAYLCHAARRSVPTRSLGSASPGSARSITSQSRRVGMWTRPTASLQRWAGTAYPTTTRTSSRSAADPTATGSALGGASRPSPPAGDMTQGCLRRPARAARHTRSRRSGGRNSWQRKDADLQRTARRLSRSAPRSPAGCCWCPFPTSDRTCERVAYGQRTVHRLVSDRPTTGTAEL